MKGIISKILFQKEANLLDSKLYILKSFLAVATAYLIGSRHEIISKDMISVLFGLMLTLEPITLTGIKNGLNQVYATLLGAISTALIIGFLGINVWTIALSVAFTLYVCLKINWREVSPVAIFTSIYMTQYVQTTPAGDPSVFLTARLRLFALLVGVIIAVIFNFLFSFVSYQSMAYKRISLLLESIIKNLQKTLEGIKEKNIDKIVESKRSLPQIFNNIDWVAGLFKDVKKEFKFKHRFLGLQSNKIKYFQRIVWFIRAIAHLNYDINYIFVDKKIILCEFDNNQKQIINAYEQVILRLIKVKELFEKGNIIETNPRQEDIYNHEVKQNILYSRLISNLHEIDVNIDLIEKTIINKKLFEK